VLGFAVIAAINQLGIAASIVNTLFMGLVGAIALAVGLAFGLGGRDVASQITQSWYNGGKTMVQKAREQADNNKPAVQTRTITSDVPSDNETLGADRPQTNDRARTY